MKSYVRLYGRLLEGIEDGIVHALTRKPVSFDGDGPLEIRPPEDSSSYSKHNRLFHWLSDFVDGSFQDFKIDREYSRLSDEDAKNLCQIFKGGNSDEIQKIVDDYQILDVFEPQNVDEINEACRKFPDLSWTVLLRHKINGDENPLWFELTWFDGNGIERPIWEYHGENVRFIRFNNHKLREIDPSTNTDNSIIIAKDWESFMPDGELEWQIEEKKLDDVYFVDYAKSGKDFKDERNDANDNIRGFYNSWKALDVAVNGKKHIYAKFKNKNDGINSVYDYLPAIGHCFMKFKEEPTILGDNMFRCFLPSMGQLRIISDYLLIINKALEIISSNPLNINKGWWWTSSECTYNYVWFLSYGNTDYGNKTYPHSVLPLFALNPAEPERRGPNFEKQ